MLHSLNEASIQPTTAESGLAKIRGVWTHPKKKRRFSRISQIVPLSAPRPLGTVLRQLHTPESLLPSPKDLLRLSLKSSSSSKRTSKWSTFQGFLDKQNIHPGASASPTARRRPSAPGATRTDLSEARSRLCQRRILEIQ